MLKAIAIVLFGMPAAGCLAILCVYLVSKRRWKAKKADAIIVLGAKINPDATPSNTLMYRLDAAAAAFCEMNAKAIIVTGGQGADEPEPEAVSMKRYLVGKGIREEAIFEDACSKNTIENLKNALSVMRGMHLTNAAIATTDYHAARALLIARRLGMQTPTAIVSKPGRRASTRLLAYGREVLSWGLCLLKILLGKL